MENSSAQNSLATMPPRSDSRAESLIREWLFRLGVNFQRDVAPYLPLWLETFGGMEPEVLRSLFERAMRTCTFFPTVAEILAPLEAAEEGNFEDEWQALLDYCERWVNRDVPNMRGKPELPADIDHAARAAGGVYYLESCAKTHAIHAKSCKNLPARARALRTRTARSIAPKCPP
jgi:hypothetical protein